MFYYLQGELAHREANICVIDCNGVGYKLTVSYITSEALVSKLGKNVKLFTHLAVREAESALCEACAKLPRYHKPHFIHRAPLPRTESGKPARSLALSLLTHAYEH